jgi:arginine exporter protein ArgO
MMAKPEYVQGIFDCASSILTIGTNKAFIIREDLSRMESGDRIETLTTWARQRSLITQNGLIAEI